MSRAARNTAITLGIGVLAYLGSFCYCFDVTDLPTRTQSLGWIGPAKRYNPQVVDIGKVYEYQSSNYTLYQAYAPLCRLWLWFNDLA